MERNERHDEPRISAMSIKQADFDLLNSEGRDSIEREVKERLIRTYNLKPDQAVATWHFIPSEGEMYVVCVGMMTLK
jgi:hypothetical protein